MACILGLISLTDHNNAYKAVRTVPTNQLSNRRLTFPRTANGMVFVDSISIANGPRLRFPH